MLRFSVIIVSIFTVLFASCSNQPNIKKVSESELAFKKFLTKFELLKLPLKMTPGRMSVDHYPRLDSTNKSFTGYKENETLYAFGMLPDTSVCFKLIWFQPADDYYPVLATFTKNGKKIKQEDIGVGGCGVDCCFECKEMIAIQKDMSIYSVDSAKYTTCDTSCYEAAERYIEYKTGKITRGGKIKISAEQRKNIY
ncbi:MAG TPA: hypothetical protein VGI43_19405 [Mucilaginibacter sp.]|jgi:hypothetical protein